MQFNKSVYYSKELQSTISNKIKLKFKNLGNKPVGNFKISKCDACGFLLVQNTCTYCFNQSMEKLKEPFFMQPLRNQCFIEQIEKTQSQSCYMLCIDISGSTDLTYLAPKGIKRISELVIINRIGVEKFQQLRYQIPLQVLANKIQQIEQYYIWGFTSGDIISNLKFENQQIFQYSNFEQQDKYISRKEIIEIGVYHFLTQLEKKDPEALVYVIYFNQNIILPTSHFQGIQIIQDIYNKTPEDMFQFGRFYRKNFEFGNISQEKQRILNHITKISPKGQTALGPALAFCFGVANAVKKSLNQIIVVTDGCSNVGFGQTESQINQAQTAEFYEKLAILYGVKNSCIVNLMVFSDEQIGYNIIKELINKTNGLPFSIQITLKNTHFKQMQFNKIQKQISQIAIQNMKLQFSRYLKDHESMLFQTKVSLFATNQHINLIVDQNHTNLVSKSIGNVTNLYLGIINNREEVQFIFSCHDQKFLENQIRFSVITEYINKQYKRIQIEEKIIEIKPGSQKEAEDQLAKALKNQMEKIRLESNDLDSYKKTMGTIKYRRDLVDEDELELFSKQFEKLKIQQEEEQQRFGPENVSIKAKRENYK